MSNSPHLIENNNIEKSKNQFDFYLVDLPHDCVLICDLKGYVINVNKQFCKIFDAPLNDVIGQHFNNTIFSEIEVGGEKIDFNYLIESHIKKIEGCKKLKNDLSLFVEIQVKLTSCKSIGLFFSNITKQKKIESDLQQLTLKLAKLNDDKNRFISILAHDLKSPFNAILGFLDILKENIAVYSKEEIENKIAIIQNVSNNTYKLLDNTLEWIGAETGIMQIKKKNYALSNLLSDVLENLESQARTKEIQILFINPQRLVLNCDANMIKTVLLNLISNAIKFTHIGGKIIVSGQKHNNEIEITITDNGVGIAPEIQSKLFNIPNLISTKGTLNEKGTGFGLILCKEFIEMHEGTLTLKSKNGIGTTFKITIPNKPKKNIEN